VPTRLADQLGAMGASACQAGVMAAATWALTVALEDQVPAFASLILASAFGAFLYGGLALALGNAAVADLARAIRDVLRPSE